MQFEICAHARKIRDEFLFNHYVGKRLFAERDKETKLFYQDISKRISCLQYNSLDEFKKDFIRFLEDIRYETIGPTVARSVDKFITESFSDDNNEDDSDEERLPHCDNFTEHGVDCLAALTQTVCNSLISARARAIASDSSKSNDTSNKSLMLVPNLVKTAKLFELVYEHGRSMGEKIAARNGIKVEEEDTLFGVSAQNAITAAVANLSNHRDRTYDRDDATAKSPANSGKSSKLTTGPKRGTRSVSKSPSPLNNSPSVSVKERSTRRPKENATAVAARKAKAKTLEFSTFNSNSENNECYSNDEPVGGNKRSRPSSPLPDADFTAIPMGSELLTSAYLGSDISVQNTYSTAPSVVSTSSVSSSSALSLSLPFTPVSSSSLDIFNTRPQMTTSSTATISSTVPTSFISSPVGHYTRPPYLSQNYLLNVAATNLDPRMSRAAFNCAVAESKTELNGSSGNSSNSSNSNIRFSSQVNGYSSFHIPRSPVAPFTTATHTTATCPVAPPHVSAVPTPALGSLLGVRETRGGGDRPEYHAEVLVCGRTVALGSYSSAHIAARAHDLALIRAIGPVACRDRGLNFPIRDYIGVPFGHFTEHDDALKRQLQSPSSAWTGPKACDFSFLAMRRK